LALEEIPAMPLSTKRRPQITLHEVRRREKLRVIDMENAKLAKKLMFVNSSIPGRKSLNKEFLLHKKTKELRCKWPIINMKDNVFNKFDITR
jgi:hypothetical protein